MAKFIEEVNKKKRSLKDSTLKTKHKNDFESYPNTNPAILSNKIEELDMEDVVLLAASLVLKACAIERLFCYVSRYNDTFIVSSFESSSSTGSEITPQDTLETSDHSCVSRNLHGQYGGSAISNHISSL